MNGAALGLAWFLSILPASLDALTSGGLALEGASKLGLASLPWIALAGIPAVRGKGPAHGPWPLVFSALPPLALGAGLDRASDPAGTSPFETGAGLLVSVLLVVSWAGVARRSAPRSRLVAGAFWFLLVPGLAALDAALEWVPRGAGNDPSVVAGPSGTWIGRSSALVLVHRWSRDGYLDLWSAAICLAIAVLAWGVVVGLDRAAEAETTPP